MPFSVAYTDSRLRFVPKILPFVGIPPIVPEYGTTSCTDFCKNLLYGLRTVQLCSWHKVIEDSPACNCGGPRQPPFTRNKYVGWRSKFGILPPAFR